MTNLLKKIIASLTAMAVVVSTFNIASVAFGQYVVSAEADLAIQFFVDNNLTNANDVAGFNPFNTATREQAAALINRGLPVAGVTLTSTKPLEQCTFTDENLMDPTLTLDVTTACVNGLVNGYNGKFMPKDVLTRGALMAMLSRALDPETAPARNAAEATSANRWTPHYQYLNERGIFNQDNGQNPVSRYELALVVFRIAVLNGKVESEPGIEDILCQLLGTCTDTETETENQTGSTTGEITPVVTLAGDLNVSVSPLTPVGQEIPGGVAGVVVGAFDITAAGSDVTVNSIRLERL
jgi:hypothetical protein